MEELREYRRSLPLITELSVDNLVNLLREQRAKNIVCMRMPLNHEKTFSSQYIVICESHRYRHANAMILNIRKFIKKNYRFPVILFKVFKYFLKTLNFLILLIITEKNFKLAFFILQ